jgi:hypothetical protein
VGEGHIAAGAITGFPGGGTPQAGDLIVWTGTAWINTGRIQGPVGPVGPTGPQGAIGPQGPKGADSTVPGPTGPTGPAGPTGAQGPKGDKGDTGAKGDTGTQGIQGVQGLKGDNGDKGDKGDQGVQGPVGMNVLSPVTNKAALDALTGMKAGDARITLDTGILYVYHDGPPAAWVDAGHLQGPQGVKGDKGDKGDIGPTGSITLGTVTTGAAGSNVLITNTGTAAAAVFNFTIPKGDKGDKGDLPDAPDGTAAGTVQYVRQTVTTGTPGSLSFSKTWAPIVVQDASQTAKGVVELATDAEVKLGTDTTRVITVKTLSDNYIRKDISTLPALP